MEGTILPPKSRVLSIKEVTQYANNRTEAQTIVAWITPPTVDCLPEAAPSGTLNLCHEGVSDYLIPR